mmetsp:Transcript_7207/g.44844  ORF Transcript_7207/g.44844 Transcript_7207/m.44844 type:complete len:557 (-) Transcript_7207:420-2090(-)
MACVRCTWRVVALFLAAWLGMGWLVASYEAEIGRDGNDQVGDTWNSLRPSTEEAYTTLLYGDSFLLGVRVLGQSIRETGTRKDLVCIASDASEDSIRTLEEDGWKVVVAETIQNPSTGPGHKFPKRFWGVYTKLSIFKLPYKKVIYLDADTIVVNSIEDAFECGGKMGFCVNLKHSEHMNTGVMVVSPSIQMFQLMMDNIATTPSYTGGDQGFIDNFFADFASAPVFQPEQVVDDPQANAKKERVGVGLKGPMGVEMLRLPAEYNADVGLYLFNSERWSIPESKLRVIHFTLGPIKPWNWWSSWLLKPGAQWQGFRNHLSHAAGPGNSGLKKFILFLGPLIIHGAHVFLSRLMPTRKCNLGRSLPTYMPISVLVFCYKHIGLLAIIFGFTSLIVAFAVPALFMIPMQASPLEGWILVYWWGFNFFGILLYTFMQACMSWGRALGKGAELSILKGKDRLLDKNNGENSSGTRGKSTMLKESVSVLVLCALCTVLGPWIPVLIPNLVLRLVFLGVVLCVSSSALSYSFWHVAELWFTHGYKAAFMEGTEMNGHNQASV